MSANRRRKDSPAFARKLGIGLELAAIHAKGRPLTCRQIAAFCNCSRMTIHTICEQALAKVRAAMRPYKQTT